MALSFTLIPWLLMQHAVLDFLDEELVTGEDQIRSRVVAG
jgi:hypothetical protein